MKKYAILAVLPLAIVLIGCPSGTQQQKAANAAANVASYLESAQTAEITVFNTGQDCLSAAATDAAKSACIVITPDEHVFIQKQFKSVDAVGTTLDSCIRTATDAPGIVACANTATATVDQLNAQGALYLKSDKSQSTYAAIMGSVKLAIQTISTVLGGTQ